jgi:lysophospholipase L1-like esterase
MRVLKVAVLGALATAIPTPASADPPKRVYVVAAMGDSLTDPKSHGGVYLRDLQQRCPESRFDSYGVGGQMVNQMNHRFTRDLFGDPRDPPDPSKPKYTHVIVFGGVNDLYSDLTAGRSVPKIEADLSSMYRAAHEHGVQVIALTVTPWGGFHQYYNPSRAATTAELNRWILGLPAAHAVDFAVDVNPLLSCGNPEELCDAYTAPFKDGIHFGPKGHEKIAEALYTQVFSDCR